MLSSAVSEAKSSPVSPNFIPLHFYPVSLICISIAPRQKHHFSVLVSARRRSSVVCVSCDLGVVLV